jgi:Tfp pilus assembly protein PilN
MRAVNLLVQERSQRRVPNKTFLAGAASSSALLMLLGAGYVNAHGTVQRRQDSLDELKAELAVLPPKKPVVVSTADSKLAAEKAGHVAVLSSALSGRVRWDRLLRELSMVLPADVWLDTLDASAPTAATVVSTPAAVTPPASTTPAAPPTATFNMVGHTYNHEGVARLLIHLQLVPDLENVQLVSTQTTTGVATRSVQFTITANVKSPGSTS